LPAPPHERCRRHAALGSVDALRGITVAAMLLVNNPGDWSGVAPLLHSEWHRLHAHRPGVPVLPVHRRRVDRAGRRAARGSGADLRGAAVLVRALRILGVGLLLHLLAWAAGQGVLPHWGVLQRIGGVSSLSAGSPLAAPARAVGRAGGAAGRYGLLLAGTGGTAQWINIASRLDTALFATTSTFDADTGRGHDPEGLLSTLPPWPACCSACAPATGCATGARGRCCWPALRCLLSAHCWPVCSR
jgi:predicted acyltransferase